MFLYHFKQLKRTYHVFIGLYLYGYLLWLVKANYENAGYFNEKLCNNKASFIRMTLLSLQFYLQPPLLDPRNVRSRKWSVHKAIWMSQHFPEYPLYKLRTPSPKFFFQIRHCKKVHCALSKFSLHSLTASWSKASRRSPTVQLDFRWTLEMFNQQNRRFARPSERLSISPSASLNHPEALSKLSLSKWTNFQTNH